MDLTQYRSKLIGNKDERAVSPVIGVILMVAITVILAAVIAAFVLDMGQSVESDVQAAANIDSSPSDDRITVTFTSAQDSGTNLSVTITDLDTGNEDVSGATLADIGSSQSWDTNGALGTADGEYRVVVVAENEDRSTTVQTTEVDLS